MFCYLWNIWKVFATLNHSKNTTGVLFDNNPLKYSKLFSKDAPYNLATNILYTLYYASPQIHLAGSFHGKKESLFGLTVDSETNRFSSRPNIMPLIATGSGRRSARSSLATRRGHLLNFRSSGNIRLCLSPLIITLFFVPLWRALGEILNERYWYFVCSFSYSLVVLL